MKNKSDNETTKLLVDTIGSGLTKFIGDTVNEDTVLEIKKHMTNVLIAAQSVLDIKSPLPGIEVLLHCNQVTLSFTDPKDGKEIEISTWVSRSAEGYYD